MATVNLYSIGHGHRKPDDFVSLLKEVGVQYLLDVRSVPYSKFNPQFDQDELQGFLRRNGIAYIFMGDTLGGRPEDGDCYTDGKVDYDKIKTKAFFVAGIQRIIVACRKDIPVALMCSESKPEECHRSKLIGEYLKECSIETIHIDERGKRKSQNEIMLIATKGRGTVDLFGDKEQFTSRKVYKSK